MKKIYMLARVLCRAAPRRQIKIKMQILPGAMVLGTSTVFRIQSMFKSTSALEIFLGLKISIGVPCSLDGLKYVSSPLSSIHSQVNVG